jgi:hypothetical protein
MTVMHPGADAEVLRSDTKKRAAARRRSSTKNYVLAIDPGKTTGIVLVRKVDPDSDGEPSIVWSDELSWPQVATRVEATLTSLYADVDLVVERFTITRATASNAQAPWSLEVIGAVKWLAYRHNAGELVMQDPASVMRFASNPRLKSLGFWHKGGKGHALDAIRHAVVFLITKDGWTPSYLV